jgi:predicted TPR repeat methyltransferase
VQQSDSIYQSGAYLDNVPDWHAADSPYKAKWISEILARNAVSPAHIVEIGCGSGETLVNLAQAFPAARLEGYDISPQAAAIAAPKATERLAFHRADYLTAGAEKADLLMAIDVFEHVEDYMGFLRAMKPLGEWKLFHIPLDLSVQGLLLGKAIMHARRKVGHLHYFFKDTALATLQDCGYEIVDWNYTRCAEMPGRPLKTRLLYLPRRVFRIFNEDLGVRLMGGSSLLVLAK